MKKNIIIITALLVSTIFASNNFKVKNIEKLIEISKEIENINYAIDREKVFETVDKYKKYRNYQKKNQYEKVLKEYDNKIFNLLNDNIEKEVRKEAKNDQDVINEVQKLPIYVPGLFDTDIAKKIINDESIAKEAFLKYSSPTVIYNDIVTKSFRSLFESKYGIKQPYLRNYNNQVMIVLDEKDDVSKFLTSAYLIEEEVNMSKEEEKKYQKQLTKKIQDLIKKYSSTERDFIINQDSSVLVNMYKEIVKEGKANFYPRDLSYNITNENKENIFAKRNFNKVELKLNEVFIYEVPAHKQKIIIVPATKVGSNTPVKFAYLIDHRISSLEKKNKEFNKKEIKNAVFPQKTYLSAFQNVKLKNNFSMYALSIPNKEILPESFIEELIDANGNLLKKNKYLKQFKQYEKDKDNHREYLFDLYKNKYNYKIKIEELPELNAIYNNLINNFNLKRESEVKNISYEEYLKDYYENLLKVSEGVAIELGYQKKNETKIVKKISAEVEKRMGFKIKADLEKSKIVQKIRKEMLEEVQKAIENILLNQELTPYSNINLNLGKDILKIELSKYFTEIEKEAYSQYDFNPKDKNHLILKKKIEKKIKNIIEEAMLKNLEETVLPFDKISKIIKNKYIDRVIKVSMKKEKEKRAKLLRKKISASTLKTMNNMEGFIKEKYEIKEEKDFFQPNDKELEGLEIDNLENINWNDLIEEEELNEILKQELK